MKVGTRLAMWASTLPLLLLSACGPDFADDPADLVLVNGTVVTLDDAAPRAEGVAVRDGRIVAVGSSRRSPPPGAPGRSRTRRGRSHG